MAKRRLASLWDLMTYQHLRSCSEDVIKLFENTHANVDQKIAYNDDYLNPLLIACKDHISDLAEYLISEGASVYAMSIPRSSTSTSARRRKNKRKTCLSLWLEKPFGLPVEQRHCVGFNIRAYCRTLQLLLEAGAPLRIRNKVLKVPTWLIEMSFYGASDRRTSSVLAIIELLVSYGASIYYKTDFQIHCTHPISPTPDNPDCPIWGTQHYQCLVTGCHFRLPRSKTCGYRGNPCEKCEGCGSCFGCKKCRIKNVHCVDLTQNGMSPLELAAKCLEPSTSSSSKDLTLRNCLQKGQEKLRERLFSLEMLLETVESITFASTVTVSGTKSSKKISISKDVWLVISKYIPDFYCLIATEEGNYRWDFGRQEVVLQQKQKVK